MNITREMKIRLYTNMVRARKLDELLVKSVAEGKVVSFFHSQQGQEAIGSGTCTFLRKDDYLFYTHRGAGLGELLPKGLSPKVFVAEHYGKVTGICNGMAGYDSCEPDLGIFGLGGTVAGELTLAAGAGLAAKLRGNEQVVACFFGDGATGRGTFHTALLMSANWKLPVIWLCSNNGMAQWVPTRAAYPKENLADLAFGYGIPAAIVDGQDVISVCNAVNDAVSRARIGHGPSFIEFKTCRFRSHVEGVPDISEGGLRSEEHVNAWKKRDPIELFKKTLLDQGVLSAVDLERIDREATAEVEEAHKFSTESQIPDPIIMEKALYAE